MAVHRKATPLMEPMEAMARLAAGARSRAEAAQTRSSGSASYDNGDGTRTVIGPQTGSATMATHVGDTTPPGIPTGVTATSTSGMLTVHWDGTLTGGVPGDFAYISVYVDGEGSKFLLGSLSRAGDLTAAGLTEGATYQVTATAEDDACLADGTPAHNVSAQTTPIDVTIAASGGTDETARQMAQEALDVATATGQYFFTDVNGTHMTDEPDNPTAPHNTLVNALGILLRAAENNMLTLTASGITLYDGQGNADANVVATFTGSGVELGRNSQTASIDMCKGNVSVTSRRTGISDYGIISGKNVTILASGEGTSGAILTVGGTPEEQSDMVLGILQDTGDGKGPTVVSQSQVIDARAETVRLADVSPNGASVTAPMSRAVRLLSDTGWTWLANYGSGDGIRWRCVAGVVYVQAAIYGEHTVGTGGWDAGTIPASYRPSSDVAVPGTSFGALTNPTQLRAGSNGNVNLWAPSNTTYFGGSLSYPLEA